MAVPSDENEPHPPPPSATSQGRDESNARWRIEPMPAELIDHPLDYFFAEHHRQREAAAILMLIADGAFDRDGVADLIDFLDGEFARHVAEEEAIFFPTLRRVCVLDDEIDKLIERLSSEHAQDAALANQALDVLTRRLAGYELSSHECEILRFFATHLREHLALENGVLLPVARARLTDQDLVQLTEALVRRRSN